MRAQYPGNRNIGALLRSVRQSLVPTSDEAASWLREDPRHAPYRRALAQALMREGNARAAVPHYARLIGLDLSTSLVVEAAQAYLGARENDDAAALLNRALGRKPHDAELLFTRAQVNLARHDLLAAEADVIASLKIAQTPEAYLLLGDLRRWRADYSNARTVYDYARRLRPTSALVRSANAQLLRAERPVPAFIPTGGDGEGWHVRSAAVSDNAGVAYATASARREVEVNPGTTLGLDLELRRLREESSSIDEQIDGAAISAGVTHELVAGSWRLRLHGRGGYVHHEQQAMFTGAVAGAGWYGPWALSLEYAHRPAYPTLLTAADLKESSIAGAFGGPIGDVDFAMSVQHSTFSDDNQRVTAQIITRVPITRNAALLGSGNGVWFAEASRVYWSPQSYVAGAVGLELATRNALGVFFALRGMAGPARSIEDEAHQSVQYSGGMDLGYRGVASDVGLTINYGTGRAGGYSRFEAGVYASRLR
jgi:tetratricopeptide (TPR) repeat protein